MRGFVQHACGGRWSYMLEYDGRFYQFWSDSDYKFKLWSATGYYALRCYLCGAGYDHCNSNMGIVVHSYELPVTWESILADPMACLVRGLLT